MKSYYSHESLRMVGKGWEVRRMLKELTCRNAGSSMLSEYLKRRTPKR
ncbi:Z-ring formation inhibitor MciZ [Paenibacillus xylaniclasticus]|nr:MULTISPECIES: Z-ring formation inhibitor MciZ [Paenibacillus]GFN30567.1 hypothetical protein PCURB6_08270 [Paenibacillus curdlanolyticus]